jgi:oligosaccharide repeat unit polymerase
MNYALVLGCFAGAAFAALISNRYFRHPFSPFSVFYAIWFLAIAAYHMNWIAYVPVRSSGWTVITISMVTFGVGWVIPYLAWNPNNFTSTDAIPLNVSAERLFAVIAICFVLGAIALATFLYAVHTQLGIASFVLAPSEIRESMSTKGGLVEPLKPLSWLNVANVALCTYYLFGVKGPRRGWVWAVLILSLLALPMLQDRIHFFFAAVWAGSVLLYSVKVTFRKLLAIATVGTALLLVQFFAIAYWLGKVAENNPILMDVANVEGTQVLLLAPYMYLTVSLPALQVHLDSDPRPTHGAMTFYPLFQVANKVDPTLEPPPVVGDFVAVPSPANTFTWLQQFYDDFGIAGVWIGPWLIGILTSFFYFHMLGDRDVFSTLMSGVFAFCLALSIYGNHFSQGPAWYFLAVCFLIDRFVRTQGSLAHPTPATAGHTL